MFPCFYLYLFIFLFASIWTQYIHLLSISLCLICYFPIWNQSVVPCPVLTVSSWPAYRFLKTGQKVWYYHIFKNFPDFIVVHTVKGFGLVNKAEIDVFLELSCFFSDPVDVGNLISGSSGFSKTSLNIWKFTVHVLLKPGLENFEHYFFFFFFHCSGFRHTLTWISYGFICVPHPAPSSCLPLHPIPLGLPSAPALSTCLMHSSADEWIRKLWYIYTIEYYSAIKKNSFESVLMRWIKLEPIIQSEVSQKDKDQYSILMHIYGI